jgi:hypothetical protein
VKNQLESVGKDRLQHEWELILGDALNGLRHNIVPGCVDPGRTILNLKVSDSISAPNQSSQRIGFIAVVFVPPDYRVGSLLFRVLLWKCATTLYSGQIQHSVRFCRMPSVAFAVT